MNAGFCFDDSSCCAGWYGGDAGNEIEPFAILVEQVGEGVRDENRGLVLGVFGVEGLSKFAVYRYVVGESHDVRTCCMVTSRWKEFDSVDTDSELGAWNSGISVIC
jgi:hypothetical protein